jgi:hypothetical protein
MKAWASAHRDARFDHGHLAQHTQIVPALNKHLPSIRLGGLVGVAVIVREVGHDLCDLWDSLWVGHDGVKGPVAEVKVLKVV